MATLQAHGAAQHGAAVGGALCQAITMVDAASMGATILLTGDPPSFYLMGDGATHGRLEADARKLAQERGT